MDEQRKPRVHGIGGIFFKAKDPGALGAWYEKHLDLKREEWGGSLIWWQRDGTGERSVTVFSPFEESTKYFEPSDKPYMINLRVDDLDGVLAALREEGCRVLDRREDGEQGRFGYVVDPEGGLIELWQPAAGC